MLDLDGITIPDDLVSTPERWPLDALIETMERVRDARADGTALERVVLEPIAAALAGVAHARILHDLTPEQFADLRRYILERDAAPRN